MNRVAMYVPVSVEMMQDGFDVMLYVARALRRHLVAATFGESWSGPQQEMERLEHRRVIRWDVFDDACD